MSKITTESLWCEISNSSHRMTEGEFRAVTKAGRQVTFSVELVPGYSGQDHLFDRTLVRLEARLSEGRPIADAGGSVSRIHRCLYGLIPGTNGRPEIVDLHVETDEEMRCRRNEISARLAARGDWPHQRAAAARQLLLAEWTRQVRLLAAGKAVAQWRVLQTCSAAADETSRISNLRRFTTAEDLSAAIIENGDGNGWYGPWMDAAHEEIKYPEVAALAERDDFDAAVAAEMLVWE